jgi:hypothetical protein
VRTTLVPVTALVAILQRSLHLALDIFLKTLLIGFDTLGDDLPGGFRTHIDMIPNFDVWVAVKTPQGNPMNRATIYATECGAADTTKLQAKAFPGFIRGKQFCTVYPLKIARLH